MLKLRLKGHDIRVVLAKDSYTRRAQQYKNSILRSLSSIGVIADAVDCELEPSAVKSAPASVTWYLEGHRLYYSYASPAKYVDNMYIVAKVIECKVNDLLEERISFQDFLLTFSEHDDVEQARKQAREILGVAPDCLDMNVIDVKYKDLARKCHPDMPEGDMETFKKINNAHKVLRRELC